MQVLIWSGGPYLMKVLIIMWLTKLQESKPPLWRQSSNLGSWWSLSPAQGRHACRWLIFCLNFFIGLCLQTVWSTAHLHSRSASQWSPVPRNPLSLQVLTINSTLNSTAASTNHQTRPNDTHFKEVFEYNSNHNTIGKAAWQPAKLLTQRSVWVPRRCTCWTWTLPRIGWTSFG